MRTRTTYYTDFVQILRAWSLYSAISTQPRAIYFVIAVYKFLNRVCSFFKLILEREEKIRRFSNYSVGEMI